MLASESVGLIVGERVTIGPWSRRVAGGEPLPW
jgi:hypothetical protein